jgi:cyclopropane-fatty-acyl-phospholipid synthase
VRFWDGSTIGSAGAPATIVVRWPAAIRRIVYAPHQVGVGRAYLAGDLDVPRSTPS